MLNPLATVDADDNSAGTSNAGIRDRHDAVSAAARDTSMRGQYLSFGRRHPCVNVPYPEAQSF